MELAKELFDKEFWSKQTWLGNSKTGGAKFALNTHTTFLDFFKFIIRKTTNTKPPDSTWSVFFQNRTKNCAQQLKAVEGRRVNRRVRTSTKPTDQNVGNDPKRQRVDDQDKASDVETPEVNVDENVDNNVEKN